MAETKDVLERYRRVAVVGISNDESKAAHRIPAQLKEAGFDIVPVNPTADTVLGLKAYGKLADVEGPIDIVEVFRPAEEAPDIARQAVEVGAKALWLQQGIRSDEARRIAEETGLDFVEDHCMGVESRRLGITKS